MSIQLYLGLTDNEYLGLTNNMFSVIFRPNKSCVFSYIYA